VVGRKRAKGRFGRVLKSINRRCRAHRHDDLEQQNAAISRKLSGHNAYYGVRSLFLVRLSNLGESGDPKPQGGPR
jgi:hypothetical protein